MKTGVFDSRLEFHELPFYEIEGLCDAIVATAVAKSEDYRLKFEEYKKNITRFSASFEFCMHELGWMLYDPFCIGEDEVLFSNGNRCYVASVNYVSKEGFDRHSITNESVGYPRLEDSVIGYDPNISVDSIKEGIVDSKGYVDSSFTDSLNTLAEIEVMFDNISDEEAYLDYMRSKDQYATKLDYLTSKKNVIAAKKLDDGSVSIRYVSENDGKVADFIDSLKATDKVADFIPREADENKNIMIAA